MLYVFQCIQCREVWQYHGGKPDDFYGLEFAAYNLVGTSRVFGRKFEENVSIEITILYSTYLISRITK